MYKYVHPFVRPCLFNKIILFLFCFWFISLFLSISCRRWSNFSVIFPLFLEGLISFLLFIFWGLSNANSRRLNNTTQIEIAYECSVSSVPLSYKSCLGNLLLILLMNMFGLMRRRRAMPANRLLHLHKQLELAFSNRHKILFVLGDCPWFTWFTCAVKTLCETHWLCSAQFFHCKI